MTDYIIYDGITHPQIESPLFCKECGKEIWGIAKIAYTLGVKLSVNLHAICYERLLENDGEDK